MTSRDDFLEPTPTLSLLGKAKQLNISVRAHIAIQHHPWKTAQELLIEVQGIAPQLPEPSRHVPKARRWSWYGIVVEETKQEKYAAPTFVALVPCIGHS